ncbi:hypothetical protein NEOLI_003389 [Neolecta irregularis DAH-3]|uniref:Uncharacterized protein n=1 Tax=Neolecta irregularis (strain DAH-3) TaxID=1198029 RepID=A0A1U7LQE8_NEOID|nr:hypothetical protein NEOLI_003389 [Neolecta irregularis DAH-3]|eukprot:OLL24772.1 hypothetical protein NEOLI_003389 [Neolecta irregularis DAH-3]
MDDGEEEHGEGDLSVEPDVFVDGEESQAGAQVAEDISEHLESGGGTENGRPQATESGRCHTQVQVQRLEIPRQRRQGS